MNFSMEKPPLPSQYKTCAYSFQFANDKSNIAFRKAKHKTFLKRCYERENLLFEAHRFDGL